MALLDSYIKNGKVSVPDNGERPLLTTTIPAGSPPTADDKVVKLPTGGTPTAGDKVVGLPNSSSYNPNSMDGVYSPDSKDILAKALGTHTARQFLKTYDLTRDPSKALFLANFAQQLIWGVLPKNKVPTHIHQDDICNGMTKDSFLGKLGKAALNKLTTSIISGLNSATGGLASNLLSLNRQPVTRQYLSKQELYGTGNGDPRLARNTGNGAPMAYPLDDTPLQNLGVSRDKKYRGDTLTDAEHKQVDIFSGTYGRTDIISDGKGYLGDNDDQYGLKKQFNSTNQNIIPYEDLVSSYGQCTTVQSPSEAVKWVMESMGCAIGYRNWFGFEPGSNHMWDIQLYPYNGPKAEPVTDGGVFSEDPTGFTATPKLPSYKLPSISGKSGKEEVFSFGKHCPVLSYTLQFGAQRSKDLPLFNGDSIHMPMGFNYEMIMSLNILDDVFGSFSNWMNLYLNKMYNIGDAAVVRYDQAAVIIRLLVFKNHYAPKYEFRFIAVPYNYSPVIEGDNAPNEVQVHVDFHIIGMKSGLTGNVIQNEPRQDGVLTTTPWTDVVISPHKQS